MIKLATVPVLFVLACLIAGIYGALHNQISYSVAPEYFTAFKFQQFRIDPSLPDRVGAAIVGWNAAWWMGLVIGFILIPLGLIIPGAGNYFRSMIRVFGVVAATTLIVGVVALAIAWLSIDAEHVGQITRYGNEIVDDVAFARAGTMHNFGYLGGLIGILTGCVAILRERRKAIARQSSAGRSKESIGTANERKAIAT
ncbi:hypothetical protein FYK55_08285 [Roseiconus nitratireducens]|uniref:Uncharacterized protein n=1 Tax=Roseiconus nitratireducens TaxID=2605748 RepID=A0A5M6D9T5_9BACT|nr:hypothetical protein [Roseiconus nitratireducens]KAA5544338.1 hypothetical protein FYK55_08285 [Roseiconus nitratireducens]